MKRFLLSLLIGALSLGFAVDQVEAKRLGGGSSQGMKRQLPPRQAAPDAPAKQTPSATPAPANNAAATPTPAAPRRSWLGPIAGLAAGLGIAALMSHLGFGEGFANIVMLMLLAIAAVALVRFMLRRFGPQPRVARTAGAGVGADMPFAADPTAWRAANALPAAGTMALPPVDALRLPADFDAAAFERAAKTIFIRMQAANDAADLNDLRQFSTPEMFASFRLDLQDRGGRRQRTDVVQLNAEVVDVAQEAGQQIVSVRYHGLLREEDEGVASPFDEVWHLVRPADGSRDWAIAGIAQAA